MALLMANFIAVLGAPNSADGTLSGIAMSRVSASVELWQERVATNPIIKLVPTGGFGAHFNTTKIPHWKYLHDAMVHQGVPRSAIEFPGLESGNTVEDAVQIIAYARRKTFARFVVVTSHIHIERCHFVFQSIAPELEPTIVGCEHPNDPASLGHEVEANEKLRKQRGVFVGDQFFPHVSRAEV
ncbi:MAG: YdcF family protein [Pseudomonadota bacterium]